MVFKHNNSINSADQVYVEKISFIDPFSANKKTRASSHFSFAGAGMENRTPLSSLGRIHNSHYTIPATLPYYIILCCEKSLLAFEILSQIDKCIVAGAYEMHIVIVS